MIETFLTFVLVMCITIIGYVLIYSIYVLIEYHRENKKFPDWETFKKELNFWIN